MQTDVPFGLRRHAMHSRLARMTPCERCSACTPVGSARAAGAATIATIARAKLAATPAANFVKADIGSSVWTTAQNPRTIKSQ
jgi:hypothetical protein